MKFIEPDIRYKEKAGEYIQEFIDAGSEIVNGSGGLDSHLMKDGYEAWLEEEERRSDVSRKEPGEVNASTFFYVREDDDRILGMVNIRYGLNEFLFHEGGHIGYSIRPSEQGKGYATQMLHQALWFCRFIGLEKVLVVCDKNNIASARVIQKCGGILENEFYSEHYKEVLQRYWISTEV